MKKNHTSFEEINIIHVLKTETSLVDICTPFQLFNYSCEHTTYYIVTHEICVASVFINKIVLHCYIDCKHCDSSWLKKQLFLITLRFIIFFFFMKLDQGFVVAQWLQLQVLGTGVPIGWWFKSALSQVELALLFRHEYLEICGNQYVDVANSPGRQFI